MIIEFCTMNLLSETLAPFHQRLFVKRFRTQQLEGREVFLVDRAEEVRSFKSHDGNTVHMFSVLTVGQSRELVHLEMDHLQEGADDRDVLTKLVHDELLQESKEILCQEWALEPSFVRSHTVVQAQVVEAFVGVC
jgi:hypothetical protein